MTLALLLIIITVLYLTLIGSFVIGFNKIEEQPFKDQTPQTKFSIIIPFRNEASRIVPLLESIAALHYKTSFFECLFVDDDSSDKSVELIKTHLKNTDISFRILPNKRLSKAPKKDAITTAQNHAKYHWIAATDADCVLPKFWLHALDHCIQNTQPEFIFGPVTLAHVKGYFAHFQQLDILSLQGTSIGSMGLKHPIMCNGANLAYTKTLFKALKGFEGNAHISSGDDVFLLNKAFSNSPKKVQYLKSKYAIVTTVAEPHLKAAIEQRLRWAAKTSNGTLATKLCGLIVVGMNSSLMGSLLLVIFDLASPQILIIVYLIKIGVDFLLLYKTAGFFKQKAVLTSYPFAALLYPFFSSYIACLSVFKSFKWKQRTFSK